MLEKLVEDEYSSLLRKFVNYGQTSFITLAPGVVVAVTPVAAAEAALLLWLLQLLRLPCCCSCSNCRGCCREAENAVHVVDDATVCVAVAIVVAAAVVLLWELHVPWFFQLLLKLKFIELLELF